MYYNNKTYPSDIAEGIEIYERHKKNDAYAANGGQFEADYSYWVYIRQAAVACITGYIAACIIGGALGVIAGIPTAFALFILQFILYWRKESRYCRYSFSSYKVSFFRKIKKYTVITVILAVIIAILINCLF